MNKQRILKEAQKIASKFSFWMVSGNIAHLYGYIYETPEKKIELEIKFDENFPNTPPQLIYHDDIKELLGDIQLEKYLNWTPESNVVDIIHELKLKIQEALHKPEAITGEDLSSIKPNESDDETLEPEEYITPDLNAYPPDYQSEAILNPSDPNRDLFYTEQASTDSAEGNDAFPEKESKIEVSKPYVEPLFDETDQPSIELTTELGLIQQEYAYDQKTSNLGEIEVYITITLSKTFIISINFTKYPQKPIILVPEEVKNIFGDPNASIETLKKWDPKNPKHIVDILHELEKKLYFIKEIESQYKKLSGEYQCDTVSDSLTSIKVQLLTYGFKEFHLDVDLEPYPKAPNINLSSELQQIINIPISELHSYRNWRENESDAVEIVREISWLVDKNSRINFEIDLLKDHYKDIKYEPSTTTLRVEMKGKMKTEDLTFDFQIKLPVEYPMKMPEVEVINEFELEAHEKIKNDLHTSFSDFFDKWTPFSYLVDLFNLISKKIFEVSVVSCVICHRIECPSCTKKIAGDDNCHAECPHCNRAYHRHCWEQTIQSFGKCGFCLR
jgi:ubiquitin-protein ligase